MMELDRFIDVLMDERQRAEAMGLRQNEQDSKLLLMLLLEDVQRNPDRYWPAKTEKERKLYD